MGPLNGPIFDPYDYVIPGILTAIAIVLLIGTRLTRRPW